MNAPPRASDPGRHPRRRPALPAAALALWVSATALPALAADTWTTPHPGVRYLKRTTARPWRIFALEVDLCAAGVSMRATADADHWRTVSSFADRVNAEAAINGDFFSYESQLPTGLAIGNGETWHADMAGSGEILFGDDRAFLNIPGRVAAAPTWARNAVSGRPLLVDNGAEAAEFNRGDCSVRHPRTAIGISEDRRKFFMAVVDGRSGASVGMNCAELADLMHGLGSWRAMNLDGGGSSAMFIDGVGVVNDPSDGSQRTVANHLGVQAQGSGPAGSCAFDLAEVLEQAHLLDSPGSSDINGDGRADICARASNGLHCVLSTGEAFGEDIRLPRIADDDGFEAADQYATLRMADIDGDGLADACVRDAEGFGCYPASVAGFSGRVAGPALTDASGFGAQKYYTTLRLADVTGDGSADVCVRTATEFRCYPANGVGFGEHFVGPALADESGWGNPDNYGTIRMGDVDGDGRADVCARADAGMRCWLSTGDAYAAEPIVGPAWNNEGGFDDVSHWSTIRLVDLDADGRADLCARTAAGLRCHLSLGDGFGPELAGPNMTDESGWGDHDNYGTLRFGDVNGDGLVDACARANARMYCWLFDGVALAERIDGPELSDDSGWGHHVYNTSVRVADVTGDGLADVCARGSAGVDCWPAVGGEAVSFGAKLEGPRWTDDNGWHAQRFFTTLRIANAPPALERCNGRDDDLDGLTDETCPGLDAGVVSATDAGGKTLDAKAGSPNAGEAGASADARAPGTDAGSKDGGDDRPEALRPGFSEAGVSGAGGAKDDGSGKEGAKYGGDCGIAHRRATAPLLVMTAIAGLGFSVRRRARRRC